MSTTTTTLATGASIGDKFAMFMKRIIRPNVEGQRRGPAIGRARIATRRAGWLPFAGPTGWPPNEEDLAARSAEDARTEPAPHR